MNWTKLSFSMILLMKVLKIYQEEQLEITHYVMKHFILLEIQNMMDMIQRGLASMSYKFFVKKSVSVTGESA